MSKSIKTALRNESESRCVTVLYLFCNLAGLCVDYVLEHCDVGRGDELVDMHRAEEPVLVFACRAEFLEICIESRHAHGLLVLEPEETFYLHRRLVGD